MADFDAQAAKAAGYSDDEIAKIANGIAAARKAGYSDQEIQSHLTVQTAPTQGAAPAIAAPPAPASSPGLLATAGREAGIAGSGLVKGALSTLALPDELNSAFNAVAPEWAVAANKWRPNPIADIGSHLPSVLTAPIAPAVMGVAKSAGIVDNPALAPKGTGENLLSGGAEGLGAALATLPLGGYGAGLRTLAGGTAGGVAGEAAHEFFPNSQVAPIVAGMAGGLAAGGLTSLARPGLEGIAGTLGGSSTMQEAGKELQSAARDWKANVLPMKLEALASPLDAKMAHNPDVDLTNFDSTLNEMVTKAGQAQPLSNLITSKLPSQMVQARADIGPSVPYTDARQLRSDLGNLLGNPKLIPGNDINKVKALYGALSQDIGTVARANDAGDEWAAFNRGSNELYRIAEGPMSKIVSDINPANERIAPEDAATKLLNAGKRGATDLQDLRTEVPSAVDELAAAHLRSSPQLWSKLSPEGRGALVPDKDQRSAIDAIAAGPSPGPFAPATHGIASVVGGEAGERLGQLLHHVVHVPPEAMALAAMSAPLVYREGKNILANPGRASWPLVGGIAGNAISTSALPSVNAK